MVKLIVGIVLIIVQICSIFALDYKFSRTEICTSSNSQVLNIKECANDEKTFNISAEVLTSIEKAFVSYLKFTLKFGYEIIYFIRSVLKFLQWKWEYLFASSILINSNGVHWCEAHQNQVDSSKHLSTQSEKHPLAFSKNVHTLVLPRITTSQYQRLFSISSQWESTSSRPTLRLSRKPKQQSHSREDLKLCNKLSLTKKSLSS